MSTIVKWAPFTPAELGSMEGRMRRLFAGTSGFVAPAAPAEARVVSEPGDLLIISGHRVGEARQTAEILEVLGTPAHPHYCVRWDDGHESIFFPGSDAAVQAKRLPR